MLSRKLPTCPSRTVRTARFPFRQAVCLLASVLLAGTFMAAVGVPAVQAADWSVYDGSEPVFLPEGPIDEGGSLLVPLRPIAERFGYRAVPGVSGAVTLEGGAAGKIEVRAGDTGAVFNGTVVRKLDKAPRLVNGSLFIPLSLVGEITDIGYAKDESAHVIQLRPEAGGTAGDHESDYWYGFTDAEGTRFVDNTGTVRLETTYTATDFGRGLRVPAGRTRDGSYVLLDRSGKLVPLEGTYYWISPFSEGLAVFKKLLPASGSGYTVRMGAMDRSGRVVVPAVYDSLYGFSDGLAKAIKNGKSVYIDHTGRTVIPAIPGSLHTESFSEGLAAVGIAVRVNGKVTERYGFIDRTGQFVIQPKFEFAAGFHDGLAVVSKNGKWGAIDKSGKWALQPDFLPGFLYNFNNGYAEAIVGTGQSRRSILVDRAGKEIYFQDAQSIGMYGEGLVAFMRNGQYGFKDLQGRTVIAPAYVSVQPFAHGVSRVLLSDNGGVYIYGLIDHSGRILWRSDKES